jgi:hypothetical protein
MHDFRYEDSYHGCLVCIEKNQALQLGEEPSPFAWLLPEAPHGPVDYQRRPDFLVNIEILTVEREIEAEYSPFSIEISHSHQQLDSRELPQSRNLLEPPLFGDGMNTVISGSDTQVFYFVWNELQHSFLSEHASDQTTLDTVSLSDSLFSTPPNFRAISITPPPETEKHQR